MKKIVLALCISAFSLYAECVINGSTLNCVNTSITDQSNISNPLISFIDISMSGDATHGINVANKNISTLNSQSLNISTNGTNAFGVIARYSNVTLYNANIFTNGGGAAGVYALNNSTATLNDTNIFTNNDNAYGVHVETNSTATLNNVNISTNGGDSHGIYSLNSIVIADNINITTNESSAYGVYSSQNSNVMINNANIATNGSGADGAYAREGTNMILSNVTIVTAGSSSTGVYSLRNSNIKLDMVNINANSRGVQASENSTAELNNVNISTNSGDGIYSGTNSTVIANNVNIATNGSNTQGVYAWQNSSITLNNANISTNGNYVYGVRAHQNSNVTLNNTNINTNGNYAYGVYAFINSAVTANNVNIATNGSNAIGVRVETNSTATLNNVNISTNGSNAYGVHARQNSNVTLNNANIATNGSNAYGAYAFDNSSLVFTGNTNISATGAYSYALSALEASDSPAAASSILITGYNVVNIKGDIFSYSNINNSIIDIEAGDGSSIYGNTIIMNTNGTINLSLLGSNSLWEMNSSSVLSNLNVTNSHVYLGSNQSNNAFADNPRITLTTNTLSGNGNFYQRLDIAGSGSSATNNGDLIIINNSSSGNHALNFNDKTTGAISVDGNESFLVVQQNTSANEADYAATFTGQADIGAYTYTLGYGNETLGESNKSIFLRGGSGNPNSAAQKSLSFLNINYLMNIIETQTLLQRMGELKRDYQDDVWLRAYAGRLDNFKSSLGIDNADYFGFQAGIDRKYQGGNLNGDYYLGLFAGYTNADIDYDLGNGEVDSYSVGVYGTYKDPNGFYIDGIVKYSLMKNDFNTLTSNNYTVTGDSDTKGFGLSLEVGKRYKFDNSNLYIEPQAQISYSHQGNSNVHSSSGLTTTLYNYDSLLTRVSAIFGYKTDEQTNIYFKTGYVRDFNGKVTYRFNNGELNKYEINGNWWDNAIGITKVFNNKHNVYLEANYQLGDEFDNMKLNAGYRFVF